MKLVLPEEALPPKKLLSCVYGWPGTGKTTASFTLDNPVLLDFDGGASRALGLQRCPIFMIDSYSALKQKLASGEFKDLIKEHGWKTVIIDTAGTMLDNFIAPWLIENDEKMGRGGSGLSISGWGALAVEFNNLTHQFKQMGMDVHMIAHAKEGDDEKIRPQMKGGSLDILYQSADLIGYMHMEGAHRVINYKPSQSFIAKSVGTIGKIQVPDNTEERSNVLSDLFKSVKAIMSEQSDAGKRAEEAAAQLEERIKEAKTTKDLLAAFDGEKSAYVISKVCGTMRDQITAVINGQVKEGSVKAFNEVTEAIRQLPTASQTYLRKWFKEKLDETGFEYKDNEFRKKEAEPAEQPNERPEQPNEPGTDGAAEAPKASAKDVPLKRREKA